MMPHLQQQTGLSAYFELALGRLRALLQRRVLWLRSQWQHDPVAEARNGVVSDAHADWLLRNDSHADEVRFYHDHPAARELTATADALAADIQLLREQAAGRQGFPLEVLARIFGLGPFECDVLLLCAAPELDPSFQPLFGYVQDNLRRDYPTMQLAHALFSRPDDALHPLGTAFNVNAPLRRYHLVELRDDDGPLTLRPLRLPERILDYLRGINQPDPLLQAYLLPLPEPLLPPGLHATSTRIVRAVEQWRAAGAFPLLNLIGPPDGGQRELAAALARALRIKLFELDPTASGSRLAEPADAVALLEREALLLQGAYFIDLTRLDTLSGPLRQMINLLLIQANSLVLLAHRERLESTGRLMNINLPALSSHDRVALWQQTLADAAPLLDIPRIVQQFHFGPSGVRQAAQAAHSYAAMRAGALLPAMEDVWAACRQQSEWQLDELAQRIEPAHSWDDLVLPAENGVQLREIAQQVQQRHRVYVSWGYEHRLNRGRGISALFTGPSGTGKTMAAEVLAQALDLPLYRIDLAGVVNKYVGETEKNLRRIFQAAEQSGTILFFDEADALFGKRTDVKDSHDRYANIEVNYLLQLMENYSGLAILATNRRQAIDRAFLRRLRFVIDFAFPDVNNRRRIWQRVFPQQVPVGRLDYNQLAQMEIAGGNIHSIALNAAFLAAAEGDSVEMKHILAAARREYAKLDKVETVMFGDSR
ncbi:MAG: ATP-binding protein [Chloroflexia bacterium]|nr:ATP-binding protein [Chloroflexia bacterium]